ncbi:MAG TPA: monovalent cation/H(+) antiporter subunit G [Streptosporangiaceae bacterium]
MITTVLTDALLALAVLLTFASVLGVLVMREAEQKLHFVTPVSLLAPLCVGLAVLVRSGWSVSSLLLWLALLFVVVCAPFLSHATVRAAAARRGAGQRGGDEGGIRRRTG